MSATFFEVAQECENQAQDFVVVTLVSGRGHIPQDPGAKAIVLREGLRFGTVGGGKVEARAIREAQALLASGAKDPVLHTWNLQRDIGMTCGGEVTYLFETHRPNSWRVRIFGAGHVAQALVRALAHVPVSLTCIDPRSEWISALPQGQSNLEIVHDHDLAEWTEKNVDAARDFFVVITQGHATDVPVLEAIFRKCETPRFVGVIGSETKGLRIRSDLKAKGISEVSLNSLRIPIGLPIGTNHPAEIAISIAAQLIQVRDLIQDSSHLVNTSK